MDDFERWANLEGPEPDEIRALLDAAEGPGMSPEQEARMQRRLDAAIAEERRKDRSRALLRFAVAAVVALGIGAGTVLALRSPRFAEPEVADQPVRSDQPRARELPTLGEPKDAGPARPPKRR